MRVRRLLGKMNIFIFSLLIQITLQFNWNNKISQSPYTSPFKLNNKIQHKIAHGEQIRNKVNTNQTTLSFVFIPKEIEVPTNEDYDEFDEYYELDETNNDYFDDNLDEETNSSRRLTTPSSRPNQIKPTTPSYNSNLDAIFDFVEFILKPTSSSDNTVEIYTRYSEPNHSENINVTENHSQDDYDGRLEDGKTALVANSNKSEHLTWQSKENVCITKMTIQKHGKSTFDYLFLNGCKTKLDGEHCFNHIQAGFKGFEIRSTIFCCPNHQLDSITNICVSTKPIFNLYNELVNNLNAINSSINDYLKMSKNNSNSILTHFYFEFLQLYDEITNDAYNSNNSTKWTIFLWDNAKFIDHFKFIMSLNDYPLKFKLDKIMATIKNHFVKFHYITQSIVDNKYEIETIAKRRLRLSVINLENRTAEFVNCKEIINKNQYFKRIGEDREHNYRLLIHKMQRGSLLVPQHQTVYQILQERYLNKVDRSVNNLKIFNRIYSQSNDELTKDLNKQGGVFILFLPTDGAFKSLRQDQIDSLIADQTCGYKFLSQLIVHEEICPHQLIKYNSEYSCPLQRANFIAVNENSTNYLFFNGQIVNLTKSSMNVGTNGVIYRLSTLKLTGVVDFLHDIVVFLKRKISTSFFNEIQSNWLDIIKKEGTNLTFFLPIENKTIGFISKAARSDVSDVFVISNSSLPSSSSSYSPLFPSSSSSSPSAPSAPSLSPPFLAEPINNSTRKLNINDYLVKQHLNYYKLKNGDVLTTLSNKRLLINAYPFEGAIPEYLKFLPYRNFERKFINCLPLEVSDIGACSAQVISFRSSNLQIPNLNSVPLLDFINNDSELSIFSNLLEHCGKECTNMLLNLTNKKDPNQAKHKSGYTIILPTNNYFAKSIDNFNRFSKNITFFKKAIQSNIFYGTYCYYYMKNDKLQIENFLNRKVLAKKVYLRIIKQQAYLNENGILIHKTDVF